MSTFNLRIEPGEHVPLDGESLLMRGFAGVYLVTVNRIVKRAVHPGDGAILLEVRGTRRVIKEARDA